MQKRNVWMIQTVYPKKTKISNIIFFFYFWVKWPTSGLKDVCVYCRIWMVIRKKQDNKKRGEGRIDSIFGSIVGCVKCLGVSFWIFICHLSLTLAPVSVCLSHFVFVFFKSGIHRCHWCIVEPELQSQTLQMAAKTFLYVAMMDSVFALLDACLDTTLQKQNKTIRKERQECYDIDISSCHWLSRL